MIKVVYNGDFGGFGLSEEAIRRYCELKGLSLEVTENKWGSKYYTVDGEEYWCPSELERHDPILVQVVEELGMKASGSCSCLQIAEIRGPRYMINEYDGSETVVEPHDMKWIVV